jgi:8-oxo-dGTP pyrophosphatase MutT (NUDIX family)
MKNNTRKITVVVVFINSIIDGKIQFLMRYNPYWDCYNFIAGKYEPDMDNSYLDAAIRESNEELGLKPEEEFNIHSIHDKPIKVSGFSKRYNCKTNYTFYLFHMDFLKDFSYINKVILENKNKWVELEKIKLNEKKHGGILPISLIYERTNISLDKLHFSNCLTGGK